MTDNTQYETMLAAAKKKLEGRNPEEIAAKANITYHKESKRYSLQMFGESLTITYPDYELVPEQEMWTTLTVLQYLDEADGTPLTGKTMTFSEFKDGGLIRGSSFDRENERLIQKILKGADVEDVRDAAKKLGGIEVPGKADISLKFLFVPNYPIFLNIWLEDDEFPASCKVFFDRSSEHYLKVEAAGTIAGVLLQQLREKSRYTSTEIYEKQTIYGRGV